MDLAYKIVAVIGVSLIGYAVLIGVFFTVFSKYGWFNHTRHGYNCLSSCKEEEATNENRWIGASFWPVFLVPLFFGWLVLVSRNVANALTRTKKDFPTAKVVEKD